MKWKMKMNHLQMYCNIIYGFMSMGIFYLLVYKKNKLIIKLNNQS